jgi:hypothetical protein
MQPAAHDGSTDEAGQVQAGPVEFDRPWAAPGAPGHASPPRPRRSLGAALKDLLWSESRVMLLLVAGGVLAAALWRALAPEVADGGNALETDAAVDGTLAGLSVLAGVVTAAGVLLWPGRRPMRRTVVAVLFSLAAGLISWQVGDRLGTPHLRADGVALVWPIATSAGLFIGSLLPGTSRRLESD